MLEINLHVTPHLLQTVVGLIKLVVQSFQQGLAVCVEPIDEDPDLHYAWIGGLCDSLKQDIRQLFKLLNDSRFHEGTLVLDIPEAEAVLRASAAVRLKIQQTLLSSIPDHQLENGLISFESLPPEQQKGYACYLFLASLQAVILEALDPSLKAFIAEEE
jgi:hypothetical protein